MIYFNLAELKRTTTGIPNEPGEAATENLGNLVKHVLDPLRELAGSPISVNSGFRSAAVNAAVGGSKTSDHMKGLAADIVVGREPRVWLPGWNPERLARLIAKSNLPFDQVIWEPTWVHVSWRWSPRRQILRKTIDGFVIWTP